MIVQLLRAIRVTDVAIALAAHGVVVAAPRGDGWPIPFGLGFSKRHQAHGQNPSARAAPQFIQGRVHVQQVHRSIAHTAAGRHARGHDHQRHTRGFLKQREFFPLLLLADVHAVIGPQYNDRVLRVRAFVQRIQQPPTCASAKLIDAR